MRDDKAVLLAKIEGTYGVDPTPTAAANAILTTPPSWEIVGKRVERSAVLPYHGKLAPINVGEAIKLSFSVELKGAGTTPNTPPRIGALLRACAFTETIDNTPGTEFTKYDPHSSEVGESVTLYYYTDGQLCKAHGCVGTVKLDAKVNEAGKLDFEFTGLYGGPAKITDTAMPSPTFGDAVKPPLFRNANFFIHAYAAVIEGFKFDMGNKIGKRTDANNATGMYRYFIQGRDVKGECDPEVVALTTFNPFMIWDESTAGALNLQVGDTAQNRCLITMPSIVPEIPKYGAREGIRTYAYSFTSHPTLTAGNNEISLKFN